MVLNFSSDQTARLAWAELLYRMHQSMPTLRLVVANTSITWPAHAGLQNPRKRLQDISNVR
jgi:hypothetical protein